MVRVLYLDTCVYMDYLLDRRGADIAWGIISRCLRGEFKLVLSDWLLYELERYVPPTNLKMFLDVFSAKKAFVLVRKSPEDVEAAKKLSEHFQDALHAILAKKAGAEVLVTRNVQDFAGFGLIKVVFPEDI